MSRTYHRLIAVLLILLLSLTGAQMLKAEEVAGLEIEERAFAKQVSEAVVNLEGGLTIRASSVKLPHVLGESEVATQINAELDAIERALIGAYEQAVAEQKGPGPFAHYEAYTSSNTLSLVVLYRLPREREEALVYTIDLETLSFLSQEDFAQRVLGTSLDPWVVTENVRLATRQYHRYARPTLASELVAQSLILHKENPLATRIFAFDDARLGMVYPLRMESGGQRLAIAEFKPQTPSIHEDFATLAQAFGVSSDEVQAFVIPLGFAYDAQSMRSLVFGLFNGMETYNLNELPAYYARMDGEHFAAQEHYYLIPKDKHAILTVTAMDLAEDGSGLVPSPDMPARHFSGPTFISMNISDIYSNAELNLDGLEFSPYISMKDGTLVLPPEVMELQFSWKTANEAQDPAPFKRLWEEEILPKVGSLGE